MDRKGSGRLPEVGLVKALSWEFHPREDLSQPPPCVIPRSRGAGTGRKYPPTGVLAKQLTTSWFSDGRDRSAPYLAVIDVEQLHTGGLGAPSVVAWLHLELLPGTCSGSDIQISKSYTER